MMLSLIFFFVTALISLFQTSLTESSSKDIILIKTIGINPEPHEGSDVKVALISFERFSSSYIGTASLSSGV